MVLVHPTAFAAQEPVAGSRIHVIEVSGLIDPIQADFITKAVTRAEGDGALLVMRLDSNGGVLDRAALLALADALATSRAPVAAWVGPGRSSRATGQAAVVYAATGVRGVAPGARVGNQSGQGSLAAEEAIRAGFADVDSPTLGDFIVDLDGRRVGATTLQIPTRVVDRPGGIRQQELAPEARVRFAEPSLLAQLLHGVASPSAAYLLVVVALLLIVFELYTAGIGVAAAVAVASGVLGVYGLGVLPTRPLGLAFLLFGIFGYAVDVQAGSPRVWTAIGTVSFVLGSVTLYDGLRVPAIVLAAVLAGVALFMVSAMPAVVRTRFSTATIGRESLIGEEGVAVSAVDPDGVVKVRDATWRARTNRATPIGAGEAMRIAAIDGLVLEVEPLEGAARDAGH